MIYLVALVHIISFSATFFLFAVGSWLCMFYSTLERILKTFKLSSFSWMVTVIVIALKGWAVHQLASRPDSGAFAQSRAVVNHDLEKLFVVWLKIQDEPTVIPWRRYIASVP